MPLALAVRIEQLRQARRIHGGLLNLCAAAAGVRLARVPIPSRRVREHVFRTVYGQKYAALREEELEHPLGDFRSLNDLFTRGVRPEFRPFSGAPDQWLCPCDGTVQDAGRLQHDSLLTLKGIRYSLRSLLPGLETEPFHDGAFAVVFLSPADCHRVFSPEQAVLTDLVHVPGSRLLVHPPFQRPEFPVFTLNERVILQLETPQGRCLVVMVAGWGVGNITFPFDVRLKPRRRKVTHWHLPVPRRLRRGEWLSTFELGSTVVLIAEPRPRLVLQLSAGQKVRYGQPALTSQPQSAVPALPERLPVTGCRHKTIVIDPSERLLGFPPVANPGDDGDVLRVGPVSTPTANRQTVSQFVRTPLSNEVAVDRIVIALPASPRTESTDDLIERCAAIAAEHSGCRVGVISDYRIHFGDEWAKEQECAVLRRLARVQERVFVVRAGVTRESHATWSNLATALHPLVPAELRTCRLDRHELATVIEQLFATEQLPRGRIVTVLGTNERLRDVLRKQVRPTRWAWFFTVVAGLFRWLFVPEVIGFACRCANRRQHRGGVIGDTLAPASTAELLELYNPWNRRHIAIAGYNTGVVHFGWQHPGQTVVKTTAAARRIRCRDGSIDVDAGITLKQITDELRRVGRTLLVLPNYSYVSAGTAFFVPVHGSGSAISTLGDTIEQVLVYDPDSDRLRLLRRGDGAFERCMYDRSRGLLLLRLRLKTCRKVEYLRQREVLQAPTAAQLWSIFRDAAATNIEVRKARASSPTVDVYRYSTADSATDNAVDLPRDSIGRLWDRLEENRLTSTLFHWLVRRFAFHTELFLSEQEFAEFWSRHGVLPLRKIQLRFMRRDSLPHSPCRDHDCIAADLLLSRRNRGELLEFLRQYLPHVRFNAGKHSL